MNRIWVDPARLHRGRVTERTAGRELIVEVSPYSLPRTVTGSHDPKTGCLNIVFKYIDDEPALRRKCELHGVVITEGLHSRKILSISIPIDFSVHGKATIVHLTTKIKSAFCERMQGVTDPYAPGAPDVLNQEVADEILTEENLATLVGSA